jgi:hypothetical protein
MADSRSTQVARACSRVGEPVVLKSLGVNPLHLGPVPAGTSKYPPSGALLFCTHPHPSAAGVGIAASKARKHIRSIVSVKRRQKRPSSCQPTPTCRRRPVRHCTSTKKKTPVVTPLDPKMLSRVAKKPLVTQSKAPISCTCDRFENQPPQVKTKTTRASTQVVLFDSKRRETRPRQGAIFKKGKLLSIPELPWQAFRARSKPYAQNWAG